ncbi:Zn 2cys6 transcription factor [Fusarium beomiforme]|uniref:Zn 2cys6 transcription factor n=1 Tax=Fusarium beomiforme TaxID=44412 RepID=A0A9P5AIV9_9HYPO|nr:Zn 2cys6 transcription factor [Fusarium beomiforme]
MQQHCHNTTNGKHQPPKLRAGESESSEATSRVETLKERLDSVFKQHALSAEVQVSPPDTPRPPEQDGIDESMLARSSPQASPGHPTQEPEVQSAFVSTILEYQPPTLPFHPLPTEELDVLHPTDEFALGGQNTNVSLIAGTESQPYQNDGLAQDTGSQISPNVLTYNASGETDVASLKDTQEELCLLRHYSDCIAPWMDLLYRYEVFSREVLTLARDHPILRYAACAVAAKQLGQMRCPTLRGKTQEHIATNIARGRLGFIWYGIKYYEKAIQTLVKSITPRGRTTTNNETSPAVSLSQGDLMVRAEGEDPIVRLLGTCILIQYEHLSANRDAWSGHLTGFAKLLDLIEDGRLLQPYPTFEQVYPWTKDIMEVKAGFWNFVVNDLEESFIAHRQTRIDSENLALWRNMGLLIEDDGSLSLTSSPNSLTTTPEHARDKILSYTLIRLLCKLVDYIAISPSQARTTGRERPNFEHLQSQFDRWFQMVSPSFHHDGEFFTDQSNDEVGASKLFRREIWFSNDLCSVTMMYYRMARMLLLINHPPNLIPPTFLSNGGAPFDLLRVFREIEDKLQFHASEVTAIVRGTPHDAVKLRAIQPLYVAGRCCKDMDDRKVLLHMLTEIQDNLGIATGYRIKELLQEWGASYQDFGIQARLTVEEQLS